jgi:hypothetical protein
MCFDYIMLKKTNTDHNEPRSGQTKVYEIGICGFTAKHAVRKGKSKDCG